MSGMGNMNKAIPKLLIVTGASRGIGEAIAKKFLNKEYSVVNLSRKPCSLEGVINIQWDLAAREWSTELTKELCKFSEQAEQVCIVHNAAYFVADNIADTCPETLREVLEVNVVAPQRLNRLLLPHLSSGSSIIYIGSTLAEKAVSNRFSYVVSKHASIGMMRANCQDLVSKQIHTANICPGFTNTAMLQQHFEHDPEGLRDLGQQMVLGRLVEPDEIAALVAFCAENPVVNGSVYHANLGQVER